MTDAQIALQYTPDSGDPRRVRLEPRDNCGCKWDRLVEERRDGVWAIVGHEIVADVGLEAPAAVVSDHGVTSFRGP
ncbi:hypothetical protein [Natrinema soli]|uniref:Uncharacterized protein n=1 Tax=Natrinema soli TaxID=1930624 RepID=A0ABD5SND4_9EURY|nr:hypothetical protein [Natrinema soli]